MPIHTGNVLAKSPEALMRSRYSAYAKNLPAYIFNTYAQETKKKQSLDEISQWADTTRWLALLITDISKVDLLSADSINSVLPTVTFSVNYIHEDILFKMSEKSRFIYQGNLWRYLDGEIIEHIQVRVISKKEPCPCGSLKKVKRCCSI